MRLTAFDFELAGGPRLTACELAVAVFEQTTRWQFCEARYWRFSPVQAEFLPSRPDLPRLTAENVEGLREFVDLWPDIEPYFRSDILVAHSAIFDRDILCRHLAHHGLETPAGIVRCTYELSKRHLMELGKFDLKSLCTTLRIPHDPHNPISDAIAAGRLFMHVVECCGGLSNLDALDFPLCEWELPVPVEDDRDNFRSRHWAAVHEELSIADLEVIAEGGKSLCELSGDVRSKAISCNRPRLLDGWTFSITGDLQLGRDTSIELLRSLGAACDDDGEFHGTSKKLGSATNAIIVSEGELLATAGGKRATGKWRNAAKAREKGKPMVLLTERVFYEFILDRVAADAEHAPYAEYVEESAAQHLWMRAAVDSLAQQS